MTCKTTIQMKEIDRIAIQERGIPSLQLMDTAAAHITDAVQRQLAKSRHHGSVLIFCGPGNNGGDGFSCAWQLLEKGIAVKVCFVGSIERMTADARTEQAKFLEAGGVVEEYTDTALPGQTGCIVDALFGVGFDRPVSGMFFRAIESINDARQQGIPVIACDIPSGIEGNTGAVLGIAVQADETVTFSCAKPGLLQGEGRHCAGKLTIADIGIPKDLLNNDT